MSVLGFADHAVSVSTTGLSSALGVGKQPKTPLRSGAAVFQHHRSQSGGVGWGPALRWPALGQTSGSQPLVLKGPSSFYARGL